MLGNAWFPYIRTLALRAARPGPMATDAAAESAALEALVAKSFERFPMELAVDHTGRMAPVVLFRNITLPNGGTLAAAYEVEMRTMVGGYRAQWWG